MSTTVPTRRDASAVNNILDAYRHLFPTLTPELASYWNFERTGRYGLVPYLTTNFHRATYEEFEALHRHIENIVAKDLDMFSRTTALIDASQAVGVGFSVGLSPWTDDALSLTWDRSKTRLVIILGHDWYPIVVRKRDGTYHDPDSPLWSYGGLHETKKYHYAVPQAVLDRLPVVLFMNLVPDYRQTGAKTTGKLDGYEYWLRGFDAVLESVSHTYEDVTIISWGAHTWSVLKSRIDTDTRPQGLLRHASASNGTPDRYIARGERFRYLPIPHPCEPRNFRNYVREHMRIGFQTLGLDGKV
ncbi:hypothetical protein SB861_52290 [Paraburkholderia sp. SIMBA_049]